MAKSNRRKKRRPRSKKPKQNIKKIHENNNQAPKAETTRTRKTSTQGGIHKSYHSILRVFSWAYGHKRITACLAFLFVFALDQFGVHLLPSVAIVKANSSISSPQGMSIPFEVSNESWVFAQKDMRITCKSTYIELEENIVLYGITGRTPIDHLIHLGAGDLHQYFCHLGFDPDYKALKNGRINITVNHGWSWVPYFKPKREYGPFNWHPKLNVWLEGEAQ